MDAQETYPTLAARLMLALSIVRSFKRSHKWDTTLADGDAIIGAVLTHSPKPLLSLLNRDDPPTFDELATLPSTNGQRIGVYAKLITGANDKQAWLYVGAATGRDGINGRKDNHKHPSQKTIDCSYHTNLVFGPVKRTQSFITLFSLPTHGLEISEVLWAREACVIVEALFATILGTYSRNAPEILHETVYGDARQVFPWWGACSHFCLLEGLRGRPVGVIPTIPQDYESTMFPIEYGPEEAELVGESSVPSPDYGQNHPEQRVTSNDDSVLSSDAISDAELQAWSVFALSSTSQFGGSGAKLITSNNLEACSESVCDDSTEYASMGGKTLPDTPTTFTELSSPTNDTDVFSSLGLISDGAADEDKSEMCTQLDQLELSQANIPQVKLSTGKETPGARKRRKAEADAQKQRRIAYQGEWRKLHRLQCRAACARWRRRNPDKVKASRENITAEQKPRYNTWSREYMREKAAELTYDEREERRENHAQKRDKPGVREKAAERSRAWREKNKGAQDSEFHTANAKLNKQIGRAKKNALAAVGKSNSFGPISLWIVKLAERYRRTREAGKIPWELPDRFLEFARLHQSSNAAERANARTLYASIEESVIKFLQKKHPKAKCST